MHLPIKITAKKHFYNQRILQGSAKNVQDDEVTIVV